MFRALTVDSTGAVPSVLPDAAAPPFRPAFRLRRQRIRRLVAAYVRGARRVAHLVLTPGSSPAAWRRFAAWADRRSVYDDASQSLTVLTGPLAGMIRHGPFVTSDLAFARGKYEPEVVAFLVEHCGPHDIAFDIGANVGYHAMLLSRLVGPDGRVVAFEPVPTTAAWLEETLRRNDLTNVTVLRTAVGASAGAAKDARRTMRPKRASLTSSTPLPAINPTSPERLVSSTSLSPRSIRSSPQANSPCLR